MNEIEELIQKLEKIGVENSLIAEIVSMNIEDYLKIEKLKKLILQNQKKTRLQITLNNADFMIFMNQKQELEAEYGKSLKNSEVLMILLNNNNIKNKLDSMDKTLNQIKRLQLATIKEDDKKVIFNEYKD